MTSPTLLWTGQKIMATMRDLGSEGDAVSLLDMVSVSALTRAQIYAACQRLVTAGLLARVVENGSTNPARWTLTPAGHVCPLSGLRPGPRQAHARQRQPKRVPTLREQFWHLLRHRKKLSIPDALEVLLTPGDDVKCASNNLRTYIRGLAKGGYITLLSARKPGTDPRSHGHRRWLLIDDTGRMPPTLSAKGTIYDHNKGSMRP